MHHVPIFSTSARQIDLTDEKIGDPIYRVGLPAAHANTMTIRNDLITGTFKNRF